MPTECLPEAIDAILSVAASMESAGRYLSARMLLELALRCEAHDADALTFAWEAGYITYACLVRALYR